MTGPDSSGNPEQEGKQLNDLQDQPESSSKYDHSELEPALGYEDIESTEHNQAQDLLGG